MDDDLAFSDVEDNPAATTLPISAIHVVSVLPKFGFSAIAESAVPVLDEEAISVFGEPVISKFAGLNVWMVAGLVVSTLAELIVSKEKVDELDGRVALNDSFS
ncbi:hypothetical protein PSPO01_11448 [Paraphaeosphaeria sporulosa]